MTEKEKLLELFIKKNKTELEEDFIEKDFLDLETATRHLQKLANLSDFEVSFNLAGSDLDYDIVPSVYIPNLYDGNGYIVSLGHIDKTKFDNLEQLKELLMRYEKLATDMIEHFA